jgi:hypothetical protein
VASAGLFKVHFGHEFTGGNFSINCCSRTSKIGSLLTFTAKYVDILEGISRQTGIIF